MSEPERSAPASELPRCPACGAPVRCGMRLGLARCWCMDHPPLAPDPTLEGCLCERCLTARLADPERAGW